MSLTVLSLPQKFKRLLQAMMLAVAVVYMTLLLYQSAYGYPGIQVSSTIQCERGCCPPTPTAVESPRKNCHPLGVICISCEPESDIMHDSPFL